MVFMDFMAGENCTLNPPVVINVGFHSTYTILLCFTYFFFYLTW